MALSFSPNGTVGATEALYEQIHAARVLRGDEVNSTLDATAELIASISLRNQDPTEQRVPKDPTHDLYLSIVQRNMDVSATRVPVDPSKDLYLRAKMARELREQGF